MMYKYVSYFMTHKYVSLIILAIFISCAWKYPTSLDTSPSDRAQTEKSLIRALIATESNFNPKAISRAGCKGLMQLKPSTAAYVHLKVFGVPLDRSKLMDPYLNVALGTSYLLELVAKYGSLDKALHAYNMGPGNVQRGRRNHKYVNKINRLYHEGT